MQRASAADAVKMTFDVIDDLFFGDGAIFRFRRHLEAILIERSTVHDH
jgi:hypothetical protein